ncbi:FliM/FliN family flagellar motor C-terminal domain-containing protein [Sphingomonas sp.]|uniref:FliM/FliN family flagellar motor C-terminal domain-containing protein n=1 Tax=Sphingomonas sp. TaxID=28214 RepID=UPI001B17972C|nr:FliM/FliN family flagellar motor C-terminal domain-containing protein [Sphingomonas sp.]MBO9713480.1 FliM/FliN family flagellar motor switch protein [Sphingomonas sp.]
MSVLEGVMVDMTFVIGSAQVPIRQILQMSRGAMIQLDSSHDDPTLVYVNGEAVATGRVLVDGENMSIEITDLLKKRRA